MAALLVPALTAKPAQAAPTPEAEDLLIVGPGDTVRLRAEAPGTIVEAAIGGGLLVPAPEGKVTAPTEAGDHWLISAARDAAGLRSPLRWTRLRVDGTAPTVTLSLDPLPIADSLGREWAAPGATVTALAEDSEAGPGAVELTFDDGEGGRTLRQEGNRASGPLGEPAGSAETITLSAVGVDAVGNRSAAMVLEVNVDARPPTGRIFIEGAWTRRGGVQFLGPEARLAPRGRDRESGLAGFEDYRLDGTEVAPEAWNPPWSEGEHTAQAVAVDHAGNRANLEEIRFTVDLTPPELSWRIVQDGDRLRVEARGTDAGAGIASVAWSHSGERWTEIAPIGPVPMPPEGITLRALDRVGNLRLVRLDPSGAEIAAGGGE
ncbi:MAG: hypothetical protein AAF481_05250 [Acidobacteriota bacterium]